MARSTAVQRWAMARETQRYRGPGAGVSDLFCRRCVALGWYHSALIPWRGRAGCLARRWRPHPTRLRRPVAAPASSVWACIRPHRRAAVEPHFRRGGSALRMPPASSLGIRTFAAREVGGARQRGRTTQKLGNAVHCRAGSLKRIAMFCLTARTAASRALRSPAFPVEPTPAWIVTGFAGWWQSPYLQGHDAVGLAASNNRGVSWRR
jgi:hypothetical protein